MPFVYVNCGGQIIDDPYNVLESSDGPSANETLAEECESHTFLTKDCVEYEKAKLEEAQ